MNLSISRAIPIKTLRNTILTSTLALATIIPAACSKSEDKADTFEKQRDELVITNAVDKNDAKTTLTIKGNVEIANYKHNETKPQDFVSANVKDGYADIKTSEGDAQTLDLPDEEYNALVKIAGASKEDSQNELSWHDLRDMDKTKLGLGDSRVVKRDLKEGIVNIYEKVGDRLRTLLHIDFETQNERNSTKSVTQTPANTKNKKSATIKYTRWELGGYSYTNNLTIPANTMIEADGKILYVNDNGEAFFFNNSDEKWVRTNSIEYMGRTSSRLMASVADNSGSKTGDMTLNKDDLIFKTDAKSDLVDRFNYYNGMQAYRVKDLNIYNDSNVYKRNPSIYVSLTSDVFDDVKDNYVNIVFDLNKQDMQKKIKNMKFGDGYKIAQDVYKQINSWSLNKNTIKIINDLSDRDLLKVLSIYNNHKIVVDEKYTSIGKRYTGNGTFAPVDVEREPIYNKNGMFQDLNDEWGMGAEEIVPIIVRAFEALPKFVQEEDDYVELQKRINNLDMNYIHEEIIQGIDNFFASILK